MLTKTKVSDYVKLISFGISGFRGFSENSMETINIGDLTALIGKNDAGKSTIFDAMDVFFNGIGNADADDFHIENDGTQASKIVLEATFSSESFIVQLETVDTDLEKEGLLDKSGNLVIKQTITKLTKAGVKTSIGAYLPDVPELADLYTLTNSKLKDRFKEIQKKDDIDSWNTISKTTNSLMRQAIVAHSIQKDFNSSEIIDVDTTKGAGKDIWDKLSQQIPVFQLFKTDRNNNDADAEIKDPLKAVTKQTLKGELAGKLDEITGRVEEEAKKQAKLTLDKLNEMDPDLAHQLTPKFSSPKWENVFKFSLDTDTVPLNKRGSGTRRLILLNYFRAQADKQADEEHVTDIIYAFEEPETAQHADHQRMLMQSFSKISQQLGKQVLITTHSPELAGMLNPDGVRQIEHTSEGQTHVNNTPDLMKVAKDVGMLPNIVGLPGRLKMAIFVEGPNDVQFLRVILMNYCPQIFENNDTVLIPVGGGAFQHWLSLQILERLNPVKFYLFDNDEAGSGYARKVENAQGNAKNVYVWSLGPIEFYFPYSYYSRAIESVNHSREVNQDDGAGILTKLATDKFHDADYKKDIEPLKNNLWSDFTRVNVDSEKKKQFLAEFKNDPMINTELQQLSDELCKAYKRD